MPLLSASVCTERQSDYQEVGLKYWSHELDSESDWEVQFLDSAGIQQPHAHTLLEVVSFRQESELVSPAVYQELLK